MRKAVPSAVGSADGAGITERQADCPADTASCRVENEREHDDHPGPRYHVANHPPFGRSSGIIAKLAQGESHITLTSATDLTLDPLQQRPGRGSMTRSSLRPSLPGFDSGRSQPDERAQKVSFDACSAARVPKGFPNLVGLPIVAVIEEIDPVQIRPACIPSLGVWRSRSFRHASKAMPRGIAGRMGKLSRHKGIRRKRLFRHVARWPTPSVHPSPAPSPVPPAPETSAPVRTPAGSGRRR
jgi:hypothetical protein